MPFDIVLAPSAAESMRNLPAHVRSQVRDALERHLRHEPTKVSKSRIKRLKGLSQPQYRLRVEEVRVFYD
ncbi:MAG TPA: type II toxin-antitoxin system RelE/ParE family toxin, partial [Vicinamibacteria bacterium]